MRDLLLTVIVFGAIPFIIVRPWLGVLMWSWLGFMNPHRFTWGFAIDFPFAQVTAIATLLGLFFTSDRRRVPMYGVTWVWVLFLVWVNFTTIYAVNSPEALIDWEKAMKIQLFAFITMMLMFTRDRIIILVVVIALSLGFFGFKGGIFSILRGGQHRVYGPAGSFIEENNALALALIMALPLLYYLMNLVRDKRLRLALMAGMGLTALAILTSHSRGALLAGSAMAFMLLLNSRHKLRVFLLLLCFIPLAVSFMPDVWFERMSTITSTSEEQDNSVKGRLTAWSFAIDVANQRFIGAGFGAFREANYRKFSPDISAEIDERDGRFQGSHSIYFRVLGEHGYFGLFLFLLLGLMSLRTGTWIVKHSRGHPELAWAGDLGAMLKVSLVGYAVGGAFLHLSYFDLYYELIAVLILVRAHVEKTLAAKVDEVDPSAKYQQHRLPVRGPGQRAARSSHSAPGRRQGVP